MWIYREIAYFNNFNQYFQITLISMWEKGEVEGVTHSKKFVHICEKLEKKTKNRKIIEETSNNRRKIENRKIAKKPDEIDEIVTF